VGRGWITAAGAGALVGMAGAAFRAAVEIHGLAYVENGTWWLAWSVLSRPLLRAGAAGAAVALLASVVLSALPVARRELARVPALRLPRAALGILALVGVCVALEGPGERLRAQGHASVVLVSIDTLRADRLVASRMPRLHALADEGTSFTEAVAAAPWTLPSHVSLLTSLLPFDHNVRTMRSTIPPSASMLAERFRDAGYQTAAFTGGVYVGSAFGYGQGFQLFEDHDEEKEGGSGKLFRHALDWARRTRGRPFFLFVHTYQPHLPYREAGGRSFTVAEAEESYAGKGCRTPESRAQVVALYDADVRATDTAVGGFLEALRGAAGLDDAVLVVLSDHGEDLWDRWSSHAPGHGHAVYQELIHVPLVVRAPGRVAAGVRLRTPVSLIDVAPTLLDLCGLPRDPAHHGRNLANALRAGREPATGTQLAENVEYGPERFTVREGDLKVILADLKVLHHGMPLAALPLEVYDLARDPGETDPTSGRHAPGLGRALALLGSRQRKAVGAAAVPASERLPEEVREQLRSLGYVQ